MKGLPVKTTNINFRINEKTILDNINLNVNSGEFVCILGPSGAGKTTLLNALSNRLYHGDLQGKVYYGDQEFSKDLERAFAFVTQEDLMLQSLTPRETLDYSGRFLMSRETTKEEREDRVSKILNLLRLNKCADSLIGGFGKKRGISGGERKRVNIGMSLVKDPQILFVDEPTSGLDAGTAVTVISVLKSLSQQGLTILCTIHQPRKQIFDMFDSLILLSSGKLVYYGPTSRTDEYFQQYGLECPKGENIADWLIDLIEVKNVKQHKFLKNLKKNEKKKAQDQNRTFSSKTKRTKKHKKKRKAQKDNNSHTKTKRENRPKKGKPEKKKYSHKNNSKPKITFTSETSTTSEARASLSDYDNESDIVKISELSGENDFDFEAHANKSNKISNKKRKEKEKEKKKKKKKKNIKQSKIQTDDSLGSHKFLDFLVGQYKKSDFCQEYAKSDGDSDYEISKPVRTASELTKLRALVSRGFKTTIREKSKIIRVFQSVIVALFVGFVYYDVSLTQDGIRDRMGLLFFALVSNTMLSLMSVLFILPKEKIIFLKESQDRAYSTRSFYLSKVIVDTPFEVLSPILFTVVLYWIAGLKNDVESFFVFMLCVVMVGNIGSSLGFFLSAGSRTPETALSLAPATFIPMLMFAGFVVDLESIPTAISWIQYLDPVKYGLAALVKNEFTDLEFSCLDKEIVQGICPLTKSENILKYYNYDDVSILKNLIWMLLFIPLLRFMGYLALRRSRKKEIGR